MQIGLSEDQQILVDTFTPFFEEHSSIARVRAAEPLGFDLALWKSLGEMGVFAMRMPGEDAFSLLDTALVLAPAGKQLASGPVVEGVLAARLLAQCGVDALRDQAASGEKVVVIAPREVTSGGAQLVQGGAVADAILFLEGDAIRCLEQTVKPASPLNHAFHPLAPIALTGKGNVLMQGPEARTLFLQAVEEWKLLTASVLTALARQAVQLAADYAKDRAQFGRQIGSFQGVAHPLANRIMEIEGAQLLLWSAISKTSEGAPDASAEIAAAYWWATKASSDAVQTALHSFGGYGLTNEYDVQLYHRRAKGLALVFGDPADELLEVGKRAWLGKTAPLPEAGACNMEFGIGEEAEAFAAETRAFFDSYLTPEWHAKSHYSYDGHDWVLYREMGKRGLLYPTWKKEYGGRDAARYANVALVETWDDYDVTTHAQSVSVMVGAVIEQFGSEQLKAEYLDKLARGDVISCLGYTEPSSGSDSFAAKTRAVRDGDGWLINGQKMFTSGGNLASHVLLLTRTDPDAPKHAGLTLFVVPMDDPGVHVDPVHTYQDERTNATFYADVRIPDWRRIGEVNGGAEIFGWALSLEQGGGGFTGPHRRTVETAVKWARETLRDGKPAIENERVLERLARTYVHARISKILYLRTVWQLENDIVDRAAGPMSKVFSSETFLRDATDLLDLAAPDTLLRGKHELGLLELSSRHASATTIYAGTSEVHRSQVAEKALGLPRSR